MRHVILMNWKSSTTDPITREIIYRRHMVGIEQCDIILGVPETFI